MLSYHLIELSSEIQLHPSTFTNELLRQRINSILSIVWPADNIRGDGFNQIEKYRNNINNLQCMNCKCCFGMTVINIHNLFCFTVSTDSREILDTIAELIRELESTVKSSMVYQNCKLKFLSPLLENFQWCGEEDYVELPGQYNGNSRPNPENHVKLVKFSESILIFKTLRFPIKTTMLGDDGKQYSFVIKYGEDLRQDQRIQQLLALMSSQIAADWKCVAHSLNIQTYAVIPIVSYCGLLAWADDTMSLQQITEKCLDRYDLQKSARLGELKKDHTNFITKPVKKNVNYTNSEYYGQAVVAYTRTDVIRTKIINISEQLTSIIFFR